MALDLITTRQAAARLRLDVSTISRWVQLGKMTPAARLENGQMLFDPAAIDTLADTLAAER
jgi:excisionase family DNA binding protein